jgi:hypothetical protein
VRFFIRFFNALALITAPDSPLSIYLPFHPGSTKLSPSALGITFAPLHPPFYSPVSVLSEHICLQMAVNIFLPPLIHLSTDSTKTTENHLIDKTRD